MSDTSQSAIDTVETVARDEGRLDDARRILREILPASQVDVRIAQLVPPSPKVGDILVASWGYEQTNIDFYQVVSVTKSGKSVRIRPIAERRVGGSDYNDLVEPVRDAFTDGIDGVAKGRTHLVKTGWSRQIGRYGVTLSTYSSAWLWDGEPESQTASGYGH